MKRLDFGLGTVALTAAGSAAGRVLAAPTKRLVPGKPYPAADGIRPNHLSVASNRSPFAAAPNASTKIPVEKTFGPPRFFAWDSDSGTVTRIGLTKAQRSREYDAMLPHTSKPAYVTVEVLYVSASSYFNDRAKEIVQVKPTVTQITELPELKTNQQTLSWSAVLKVDLSDNDAGRMLHTSIDAAALTSLRRMPVINGIALFSIPYTGTALHHDKALAEIDNALATLNSLVKIGGGIPGVLISAATVGAFSAAQSVVDQLVVLFAEGRARNEEAFSSDAVMFAVTQGPGILDDENLVRVPKAGQEYILIPGGDPSSSVTPQSDDFENAVRGKRVSKASSGRLSVGGQAENYLDLFNYAVVNIAVESA